MFSIAVLLLTMAVQSDDALLRRAYFGVALEKTANGNRVTSVALDSTAAAAGIAVNDLIESVDGRATETPEAVIAAIVRHKSGESVRIGFSHAGSSKTIEVKLKGYPFEEMANSTVHYGSVASAPGVNLRTIVSVPSGDTGRRYPAVLLLQGGGCGSVDAPFSVKIGQPGLVHIIGAKGFVTMRVDKPGVGDSGGPPCESIGYAEELAGYPSVDPQRIYLMGISLGGVFAPVLAADANVAGVVVYGTLAIPPPPFPGRSERFFKEFAPVDIAGGWARVNSRVLVIRGEYDVGEVINRESSEGIVRVVNSGKGRAEYRELAGLDHCWTRHPSLEASKDRCGQGAETPALSDAILTFLGKN
jgi:membrane-associated protease RseP (regulator of RpoE activity)